MNGGLVVDLKTGEPKLKDSPWRQFTGSVPAGQTAVIDSIPLSQFDMLRYEMSFFGATQDDVKSLSMRVQQFAADLKDHVYGKTGSLSLSLEAVINGTEFELRATNSETFSVGYCLTVLTT